MSKCHVGSVHELRDRVRSFLISTESPYYRERKSFHSYSVNNRGLQTSVSPSESPICEIETRSLAKKGGNEANQRRKYWEAKQCADQSTGSKPQDISSDNSSLLGQESLRFQAEALEKLEDLSRRIESIEIERYAFLQEDVFDLIKTVWKKGVANDNLLDRILV